jgi:hypothetical protein
MDSPKEDKIRNPDIEKIKETWHKYRQWIIGVACMLLILLVYYQGIPQAILIVGTLVIISICLLIIWGVIKYIYDANTKQEKRKRAIGAISMAVIVIVLFIITITILNKTGWGEGLKNWFRGSSI